MLVILEMLIVLSSFGVFAHIEDSGMSINIREAKAFLTRPKRSNDCTDEPWCEENRKYCSQQYEVGREAYCRPISCPPSTTCYLSQPCYAAHHPIETACTVDLCMSYPCESGGTCSVVNGRHHCQCVPGYDPATDCATDLDECHSNPCRNGGTCKNLFNAFSCRCVPGYDPATHCATDLDECQSNPCRNGGKCKNLFNAFSCSCVPGYDPATHCATDLDECQSNPCRNGGTCKNLFNAFSCSCVPGYDPATHCATDLDECQSNPCRNGGTCKNLFNAFSCSCVPGYDPATHCSTDYDECQSNPCRNGGTCKNLFNAFSCNCVPGYDPATDCAIEFNECLSNPCHNGGTCKDLLNSVLCRCVPGYDPATHCATDLDECQSNPCLNGGTCKNLFNAFSCSCVPGYDPSTHCATDFDECQSNPCANGGTCNNLFNAFSCGCTNRYVGTTCEKDCRPGPVDVVFLLDTSSSVENDVNRSIDFIDEFVRKVPIGPNDFQVGVITYNFDPTVLFDLNDHTSVTGILKELRTIQGEDAATFTGPALQKAAQMLSSSSMGARAGVSSYIVLLYDGLSSDRNDAVSKARSIRSMGGRILTVGIGQSISHSEMLKISGDKYYDFSPLHLEDMYSRMLWETVNTNCTDCSLQTATEVIILLDSSNNQSAEGYQDRLTAIRLTIQKVLNYNPSARIGMYSYSDELEEVFSVSWSSDKDKLIAAALQIDLDNKHSQSNTSHSLQHIRTSNYFSAARKLIIVLSDGYWNDQNDIKSEIQLLEQNGVEVVGVITGEDCNVDNYNDIIMDRSQLYAIVYDDITSLDLLAAMTTYYQCVNNIFALRQ